MLGVVATEEVPAFLPARGETAEQELRAQFAWARHGTTCLVPRESEDRETLQNRADLA